MALGGTGHRSRRVNNRNRADPSLVCCKETRRQVQKKHYLIARWTGSPQIGGVRSADWGGWRGFGLWEGDFWIRFLPSWNLNSTEERRRDDKRSTELSCFVACRVMKDVSGGTLSLGSPPVVPITWWKGFFVQIIIIIIISWNLKKIRSRRQ